MSDPSKSKFASARATLQQTERQLATLLRVPSPSSTPPPSPAPSSGKLVGDVMVTTSEEELAATVAAVRAKRDPAHVDELLRHVEQLLTDGELRFTHSRTRAIKVR